MKIAVFGANGFLGSRLCRYLDENGNTMLRFSSRDNDVFDNNKGLIIPGFSLDQDIDCVVYLSQSPYHRQLPDKVQHVWNVNVTSAIEAARLSVSSGVKRFIYTSTGNVFKPSFEPLKETDDIRKNDWYALSKLHAEEALSLFKEDMEINILRMFNLYGPGQNNRLIPNLIRSIRNGIPVVIEPADGNDKDMDGLKLSLCHVNDAVNIISYIIYNGGPRYLSVASDEVSTIRDIVVSIGNSLGIQPVFEISTTTRSGNLVADITELKKLLNPEFTTFDKSIKKILDAEFTDSRCS